MRGAAGRGASPLGHSCAQGTQQATDLKWDVCCLPLGLGLQGPRVRPLSPPPPFPAARLPHYPICPMPACAPAVAVRPQPAHWQPAAPLAPAAGWRPARAPTPNTPPLNATQGPCRVCAQHAQSARPAAEKVLGAQSRHTMASSLTHVGVDGQGPEQHPKAAHRGPTLRHSSCVYITSALRGGPVRHPHRLPGGEPCRHCRCFWAFFETAASARLSLLVRAARCDGTAAGEPVGVPTLLLFPVPSRPQLLLPPGFGFGPSALRSERASARR